MALLPLVGWAQTATLGEVGVGKYTYGDDDLPVPVVKDSEGAILTVTTHYTVSADAYDKTTNAVVNKEDMKGGQELYLKITGAGAYIGQEKKAYFTVQKKVLHINVTKALQRDYQGTIEPTLDGTDWSIAAGDLEDGDPWFDTKGDLGTLAYTYAGYGKPETAGGEYDITFSGLSSDCYAIEYPAKKFTIVGTNLSTETVTVKAGTAFANKTYKGAEYTPADLTGLTLVWGTKELVQGTDFTIAKGSGDWKAVGTPSYTVNFKGNYSGTKADFATFKIDKAPITVSMEDYEITYDNVDHKTDNYSGAVTFTYMGLVGEDVANYATVTGGFIKPTKVQVGSTAKDVKTYNLTISGGSASANYEFKTYLKGKLIIKPRELTITADNAIKAVGDNDPAFAIVDDEPSGIITDYKVTDVTYNREKLGTPEGEEVGSYTITPTSAKVKKGADDQTKNYTFKFVSGKLTIGKGAITVTFKNASKFYGEADPDWTADDATTDGIGNYIVTGLQKGDALPAFTITRAQAGTPEGEAVGYYTINATIPNPNSEKYTGITIVPGTLQIKKAPLTFTIPSQTLAVGADATALKKDGITIDGIKKESDKANAGAALYELSFGGGADATANAVFVDGIYATLTAAAQANYVIAGDNKVNVDLDDEYEAASGKLIVGTGGGADILDLDLATIKTRAGEIVGHVSVIIKPARLIREVPAGTAHPWAAEIWNTMVLPFEVTVAELSAKLGYCIVNVVDPSKTTKDNVQFKLTMQTIPANTPFCVKTSEAIPAVGKTLTFDNKLIVDGGEYPEVDAGMGYKFVGAYKGMEINKTTPTYNFLRGDNNKWAHIGEASSNTWTVVPFDAYINLTAEAAARGVTFTFEEIDGTATVIKAVDAEVTEIAESAKGVAEGWYTLNGIKLNAKPSQKGLYIFNGKKVAIK